jgi:tRNA 2-selenouridine synthase SelU
MTAVAGEWTGYLSDEKCAVGGAKSKTAAEWIKPAAFEACVKKCVQAGEQVVFVTEDNKIVKIDAQSMDKVMPVIGHKVKVTGKIEGDKLKVDSISSLPM